MVQWGFDGWVLIHKNLLQFEEVFIGCLKASVQNVSLY